MRPIIIHEIHDLMKSNKNVYFLTGDLGYSVLEKIEQDFPDRFINVGIAEQNMIGIAAGLALSGKKVFVYSIIPFVTLRCLEHIRNDMCYHNLDITILGTGAGLSYGILSSTHFALEDIALLRPFPNMTIFSPADATEGQLGMQFFKTYHKPLYFRIGKKEEPTVYTKPYKFEFGCGVVLRKGSDATIIGTGPIIYEVLQAADRLEKTSDIKVTVINIHTIKPIDRELILKETKGKKTIFTVEEHGKIGGLGSAVCEILSQETSGVRVVRIGTEDQFISKIGTQSYLRRILKLDAEGIYKNIIKSLS